MSKNNQAPPRELGDRNPGDRKTSQGRNFCGKATRRQDLRDFSGSESFHCLRNAGDLKWDQFVMIQSALSSGFLYFFSSFLPHPLFLIFLCENLNKTTCHIFQSAYELNH